MRRLIGALAVSALCGAALVAQEARSTTLLTTEHYLNWERVSDAQISPDGSRIVYTRQAVNQLEDKWESSLWIMNADGAQHRFLVKGSAARWSTDGKRLLYLATQITPVVEAPRAARWSPDGKSVAFSMFVADQEKWTISMPSEPKGAKWTPAPRVVGTIHYRQDQVGYLEDGFTHLFVVPAEGGTARQLTTGKWSVGAGELRGAASIDWTPDSKSIVVSAARG
jgi:Tol biopolymer transport system component